MLFPQQRKAVKLSGYNHKFNVSILLTIPLPSNVHGIKRSFVANPIVATKLAFHNSRNGLQCYMYVVQQSSFYFSRNTNFATKIADNKIRPLKCSDKKKKLSEHLRQQVQRFYTS